MPDQKNTSPKPDDFIAPVCHDEIEILYQDEHLLAINKPSGLLTLSGKNPLNKDSVHFRLVQDFPSASMLHRLDFGTSGILIIALNKDINRLLNQQFQAQSIIKKYEALLYGIIEEDSGEIDSPIAKDSINFPLVKICHQKGKSAVSHFKVMQRYLETNRTRVQFTPKTGRTHQLRIHSREIEHPILGDDLYAHANAFNIAQRLCLHARDIYFQHPITKKEMHIHSTCPF